jgi:tetratricopeptide (TPR) repeat protein
VTPQFPSPARRPQGLALAAAIVLAALAVFSRALWNGFVLFDDNLYVTANLRVQQGLTLEGVAWAFRALDGGNWHPLTWLAHMLDVEIWGLEPAGHHATSVLLHAVNAALLYAWLWRTTGAAGRAAMATALFALHPLRVESVVWVAERKDLVSTLFWLLALHAWVGWTRRRSRVAWSAALAAFVVGLTSKSMLVTLPFTLLLVDVWPLRRLPAAASLRAAAPLLAEKLPFFAVSAAGCALALMSQGPGIQESIPPGLRVANAVLAVGRYLAQSAWPAGLAPMYLYEVPLPVAAVAASAVVVAAFTIASALQLRARPHLFFGWLWFLGTLVPVLGLVQIGFQSRADRYTYVPHIGLAVAAAWVAADLARWLRVRRGFVTAAALAWLVALSALSWRQIGHWRDTISMWERTIAVTRNNWFAHTELGIMLVEQKRLEEAEAHFARALALVPTFPRARANWGNLLLARGETERALEQLRLAARAEPRMQDLHHHMGVALERLGNRREALVAYRAELDRDPDHVDSLERTALLLAFAPEDELRDRGQAYTLAQRAVRLTGSNDPRKLALLSAIEGELGMLPQAIEHGSRAVQLAREQGERKLAAETQRRVRLFRARMADSTNAARRPALPR